MRREEYQELLDQNHQYVEKLKAETDKIVIFGAGNTSKLYEKCYKAERLPIAGFIDNDTNKIGKCFLGGDVTPANQVKEIYGAETLVLIATPVDCTYRVLAKQMRDLSMHFCGVDEYVFSQHVPELMECFDSFADETSRELYAELIAWRIRHQKTEIHCPYEEAYFSKSAFLEPSGKEVFVDMGAFVGDTIERYLIMHQGVLGRIYAFEPDLHNLAAMRCRVERLRKEWGLQEDSIQLLPYGVGRESQTMVIEHAVNGLGSKLAGTNALGTGQVIKVVALDDYFREQSVSFLKADIESFEYDMLCGAEKVIRRDVPKMAICIYHNATDMFRTMLWLKRLDLGYCFSLGHHSVTQAETVLYAYI